MSKIPFCFVVMPFSAELDYFYLYIRRYLIEKHGLRVERGDHRVLTKSIMDKVRDQIVEADLILGDISANNPNVFYEIGLAHAFGKPVIFLTQDDPADAPVDVRQFEFIHYDLRRHEEFLSKLDNAVRNIFVAKYRTLYDEACELLRRFNVGAGSSYFPASLEDFQARVMRGEQTQDIPAHEEEDRFSEFMLPKILNDATDVMVMRKVMQWVTAAHGSRS